MEYQKNLFRHKDLLYIKGFEHKMLNRIQTRLRDQLRSVLVLYLPKEKICIRLKKNVTNSNMEVYFNKYFRENE